MTNKDGISELIISFGTGQELVMDKIRNQFPEDRKYQEVSTDTVSRGTKVALPAMTLAEISSIAPEGLFTTLVDPELLSKLADGTYTTMIRENGQILKHVGFEKIDFLKVNSLIGISIAMQAMSLVSGQYYLTEINSKLDEHTALLNELIDIKHSENDAIINSVIKTVTRIVNKTKNELIDIDDLHRAHDEMDKIYEFYNGQTRKAYDNVLEFIANKAEKDSTTKFNLPRTKSSRKKTEKNLMIY